MPIEAGCLDEAGFPQSGAEWCIAKGALDGMGECQRIGHIDGLCGIANDFG
jgi:hypothetical protein